MQQVQKGLRDCFVRFVSFRRRKTYVGGSVCVGVLLMDEEFLFMSFLLVLQDYHVRDAN